MSHTHNEHHMSIAKVICMNGLATHQPMTVTSWVLGTCMLVGSVWAALYLSVLCVHHAQVWDGHSIRDKFRP